MVTLLVTLVSSLAAIAAALGGYSLKAAFTVAHLRVEVATWRANFENEKARADALTRRDDEERVTTLTATKLVDALLTAGIIKRAVKPEVAS